MSPRRFATFGVPCPRTLTAASTSLLAALTAAALALILSVAPTAQGHSGGRYGTADDMERTLAKDRNVLLSACNGFGAPRRRTPGYEQFQEYKHFRCWVVINQPYRQLCVTIHTLRNGRIFVSRRVLAQEARSGDCG